MPRAFLMQYKKKPKVNVIYQEADTTQVRARQPIMTEHTSTSSSYHQSSSSHKTKHAKYGKTNTMTTLSGRCSYQKTAESTSGADSDEEISVTDSEDEALHHGIHPRSCYDDSGCHEDGEDFPDEDAEEDAENEDDEKDESEMLQEDDDMADDEEDEEINVGDNEYGHLENQSFLYNHYQNFLNQQPHSLSIQHDRHHDDEAKNVEHFSHDRECGDHTDDTIGGNKKHHSAFRKPVVGHIKKESHCTENNRRHPQKMPTISNYGADFGSYMDARHPVANYWLHMSKLYHQGSPPGPPPPHLPLYPHPLAAGVPLEQGAHHLEALHKQMLHHNMLYIKSHGLPPGYPAMYLHPHQQVFPGVTSRVSPRSMVSPVRSDARSPTDSHGSSSRDKCPSPSESRPHQISDSIERKQSDLPKEKHSDTSPHERRSTSAIRSAQLAAVPAHPHSNIPLGMPYPFPPGPQPAFHPAQISPSSIHPITSSVSPSNPVSSFGTAPVNHPFLYQGVLGYGTRRARDPNKPPPVKKYKCDICSKAFSRSNTLVTHRRIHTGEKPFKCEICSRAFRQPGNLTRHRLTHTTVKPYVCVVCKKAFNRASNLHTHMRTHSNFRPFLCPYCGKSFQQKVDLKIHMYTHGGAPQSLHGVNSA